MERRTLRIVVWACLSVGLGCGDDPASPRAVTAVEVTVSQASVRAGDSLSFRATLTDAAGAEVTGVPVIWASSDPTRLTVEASGDSAVAEALSIGDPVTVTATVGEVSNTAVVSIVPAFAFAEAANIRTCALDPQGIAYCWGRYSNEEISLPRRVVGGHIFTAMANGGDGNTTTTCGLTDAGRTYCWPTNSTGTPTQLAGDHTFTSLAKGGGDGHRCALTAAGAAYCWGYNRFGQFGNGATSTEFHSPPLAVSGGLAFSSIVVGGSRTCALQPSGATYCWGTNDGGELGDGTTVDRLEPVAVAGDLEFEMLAAGGSHTCGLATGGVAYCWGANSLYGQLGDGTKTSRVEPTLVSGGISFVDISAGRSHTCGLTADGIAYCWGSNAFGQLGSRGALERLAPHPVEGGHRFALIRTGSSSTCGVTVGGRAMCWGNGTNGQLGNGGFQNSFVPVFVKNPVTVP
jgi:alpha-tubulin suppressor-like RCC1 family protein